MSATVRTSVAHDGGAAFEQHGMSAPNAAAVEQKAPRKRPRTRAFNDSVALGEASDDALARSAEEHYIGNVEETKRDRVLNVRLTEAEVTMLGELARHEGLNVSDWVRTTIRVEHARTFRPRGRKHGKRWR